MHVYKPATACCSTHKLLSRNRFELTVPRVGRFTKFYGKVVEIVKADLAQENALKAKATSLQSRLKLTSRAFGLVAVLLAVVVCVNAAVTFSFVEISKDSHVANAASEGAVLLSTAGRVVSTAATGFRVAVSELATVEDDTLNAISKCYFVRQLQLRPHSWVNVREQIPFSKVVRFAAAGGPSEEPTTRLNHTTEHTIEHTMVVLSSSTSIAYLHYFSVPPGAEAGGAAHGWALSYVENNNTAFGGSHVSSVAQVYDGLTLGLSAGTTETANGRSLAGSWGGEWTSRLASTPTPVPTSGASRRLQASYYESPSSPSSPSASPTPTPKPDPPGKSLWEQARDGIDKGMRALTSKQLKPYSNPRLKPDPRHGCAV